MLSLTSLPVSPSTPQSDRWMLPPLTNTASASTSHQLPKIKRSLRLRLYLSTRKSAGSLSRMELRHFREQVVQTTLNKTPSLMTNSLTSSTLTLKVQVLISKNKNTTSTDSTTKSLRWKLMVSKPLVVQQALQALISGPRPLPTIFRQTSKSLVSKLTTKNFWNQLLLVIGISLEDSQLSPGLDLLFSTLPVCSRDSAHQLLNYRSTNSNLPATKSTFSGTNLVRQLLVNMFWSTAHLLNRAIFLTLLTSMHQLASILLETILHKAT